MIERRVPLVTLIFIGANFIAAFALLVSPELVLDLGFQPNHPRPLAALTSLFLHANLLHLLGNMVFLAAVGAAVELATGSLRFAAVYFVSGLIGVAVHYLAVRNSVDPAPVVGASGAIAGCAAYYSVRYTALRVPLAPRLAISVAAVTVLWLCLQVAGAFVRFGSPGGGTSFWSHLGGFAAGVLLSFSFRAPDMGQIRLGHEVLEKMNDRGPAAVAIAARRHLQAHPGDRRALWDLADAQRLLGESVAEFDALIQLMEGAPEDDLDKIVQRIGGTGRVSAIPAVRRLQLADRIAGHSPSSAKMLLRTVVEGPPDEPQRADAILALAALEREESPESFDELLRRLATEFPLHPAAELARKRGWMS